MGYDLEFIQAETDPGLSFPLQGDAAATARKNSRPVDADDIREALLALEGCRPGPGKTVDFLGKGLNYARFDMKPKAIHVDNNCGAAELLRVYEHLRGVCPDLLIVDLQSGHVHDSASFQQWWSRPL